MQRVLDACRWVYNKALEVRRNAWKERRESLSLYDTTKMLTGWKKEHQFLSVAYSQSLQEACTRVDLAFKAFFRRVKRGEKPGYPRFHGPGRYSSFTFTQSGFKLLDNKRLRLSKIGDVRIKLHRPIEGRIKRLTIRRDGLGNWYACFMCEVEPERLPLSHKSIGVDLGLSSFATLSTGEKIDNPRFLKGDEEKLAKAQRRLSKLKKGTEAYNKVRRAMGHIHKRIANRRRDFAHKLSRRLVNEFQFIAFEDLDIKDMQNGNWHSMNKSIGDVAWNQFVQFTCYKAEWAGRKCVLVDPRNTTQMCSGCGKIVRKSLSDRVHSCPYCGLVLDRDHNAALNILARGLASIGSNP